MDYFKEIIGYEPLKKELERVLDVMKNKERYDKLGVKMPRNFLLYGKPGLGKSLIATTFIKACGWNSYVCRKTKPNGDFVDEIRNIFNLAKENQPAIILLDDLDKFANEDIEHCDAEEYITIQSCIDEVKDERVFVFATANNIEKLPSSLYRSGRFDKKYEVEYPFGKDAEKLVKYFLSNKVVDKNIDHKLIADILGSSSCAEIETVMNEAGIYAGYNKKDAITIDDIVKACMKVLFKAPESLDEHKKTVIKQIAYHEAGHAVIAEVFNPNSVNIVSVCKYDKDIGGITSHTMPDDYWVSLNNHKNKVITLLGGRAATELIFGSVDIGAVNDMERAQKIVERWVTSFCVFGFDVLKDSRVYFGDEEKSEISKSKTEALVGSELEKCYHEAKRILAQNRDFLDILASELIEKKTLIKDEIQEIKNKLTIKI